MKQESANLFDLLKTGLEMRGYHQFKFDPCLFYIKNSVI